MPKVPMDYSKAVIYKICCKDTSITDVYVGSTTNLVKRRYDHKISSTTKGSNVYQFIRDHGGFENWDVVMIEQYPCNNYMELHTREREWMERLKATLNQNNPIRFNEDKYCIHNRQLWECKECGGGGICEHNRRRERCVDCGGSQICDHNRRRDYCKECNKDKLCEHGRLRCNKCNLRQPKGYP